MNKITIRKYVYICLLTILITGSFSGIAAAQLMNGSGGDANLGDTGGDSNSGHSGGDSNTNTQTFYLQNPLDPKFNTVGGLVNGFIDIFTYLVIIFAVLMIIYVGLRFVLAQGNKEELSKRKDQLLWLLVGVGIVIGARILITVVINTLQATGVVNPSVINSANNAIGGH